MRILGSMVILVALSACVEDRSVTLNRLKLKCKNDYGFVYDSPEMAQCVMALDGQNTAANQAFFQNLSQTTSNYNRSMSRFTPVPVIPYTPPTYFYPTN